MCDLTHATRNIQMQVTLILPSESNFTKFIACQISHYVVASSVNFRMYTSFLFAYVYVGQVEAAESNEGAPEPSEVEVGGVKVVPLGQENSGDQSVVLRTAAGFEEASNFLKQSLYGGRQKRIPG